MRHRICAYRDYWRSEGYSLTLKPFLTHGLFRRRRQFGPFAAAYKVGALAFCVLRLLVRLATVSRYDVVIIHREAFPIGGAWFERMVARLNPRTVFDFDDALWLPMPLVVNQRRFLWDPERVARTIASCAAVVAGNVFLRSYAGPRNAMVAVIPTPYPDLGGPPASRAPGPPVIVWIGNVGNEEYLELVREPLERLARKHEFVLRVIGSPEASRLRMEGVNVEVLEWREDREREWLLGSSIGIMPLHDREYERGKCSFKLVQYLSAGMPVVASPIGMNTEVVKQGENGFLAANSAQWYEALDRLLGDSALRHSMGARGYSGYRRHFTPAANAQSWVGIFRRLERSRLSRTSGR